MVGGNICCKANSVFLTRIPEPVSTAYVPLKGGVCIRTKGVERCPVNAGQGRDVDVRNGREMVAFAFGNKIAKTKPLR